MSITNMTSRKSKATSGTLDGYLWSMVKENGKIRVTVTGKGLFFNELAYDSDDAHRMLTSIVNTHRNTTRIPLYR